MKPFVHILLTLSLLSAFSAKSQTKDSTITTIYTDYKSYWTTSTTTNSSVRPDTSHNLLGFKFRNGVYSTGVNDAMLTAKLGSNSYNAQVFKSLPIKNIAGTVKAGAANNLTFPIKNDGDSTKAAYKSPYPNIHIADLLTDGKNGLDLGTGVTNLPKGGHISLAIKNLSTKSTLDTVPDLVFTQIAEPTTNEPDTIYFTDAIGNIVGSKKLVYWNTVKKLGTYKLDLYTLTPGVSCNTSIMNGIYEQNGTRDIRMVAFLLTEFGVTTDAQASQVKSIQIDPSGSSDQAFIAYNTNTINLDAPAITTQPATKMLCSSSATSATFSVAATGGGLTYQWRKNGAAIDGATSSSYTANGLTIADTTSAFSVTVSNTQSSVTSDNAYVHYVIVSQPSATTTIATGNSFTFSALKTSGATSMQWQKDGNNTGSNTASVLSMPVVNRADSGIYSALVYYNGGSCTTNAYTLKTSIVLYAKPAGDLSAASNWGVNSDGTGSTPLDFTRSEHTFIVNNRNKAATGASLTIAGTLDLSNANVTITPGTTLTAATITRSYGTGSKTATGVFSVFPSSNLVVGLGNSPTESNLYFDAINNTIGNLTIAAKAAVLHSALNITSGNAFGVLQVNYGTLYTSDLLTLKSDSLGTASIAKSAGTVQGKVTIEKFVHARRAWRFIGAPVSATDAPSINVAWQEGATSSTANPAPGFGTHITGGTEANGFDLSPTNNASLKYRNAKGIWTALPNTNKTAITQYPAYMLFVRGNRSYDITTTTYQTTPMTTILRVKGNINQGQQAAQSVPATGLTSVVNPYACPVSFNKLFSAASNIKRRFYVWDPTLAGENGVGAWVIVDGTTASGTFRTTPPSNYASAALQAGQGFMVESADGKSAGSFSINEDVKDLSSATTINADRVVGSTTDTSLEVNLKLFNADGTANIADGVLYNFSARNSNAADAGDATKLWNTGENISIAEDSNALAIDSRMAPKTGDSLKLNMYNIKAASYQLEVVPSLIKNITFALYDNYLNTLSPISATDTTRITFSILSNIAASKAANRFTIVTQKSGMQTMPVVQPQLAYTSVKAIAKNSTASVEWNVENEAAVLYYQVQKSTGNSNFTTIANVLGANKGAYSFTDASSLTAGSSYRIMSTSKSGDSKYSQVVSIQPASNSAAGISVYPNPLTGTAFTLTFSNMAEGTYTVSVVNNNGAAAFSKSIVHNGGTSSQKVILTNKLSAGIYYIKTTSANGITTTTKVTAN